MTILFEGYAWSAKDSPLLTSQSVNSVAKDEKARVHLLSVITSVSSAGWL